MLIRHHSILITLRWITLLGYVPHLHFFRGVSGTAATPEEAPDYYDMMRRREDGITIVESGDGNEDKVSGSNIYQVTVEETGKTFRLANIQAFLPLSSSSSSSSNGTFLEPTWREDAFIALLAVYHFNNIQKSLILSEEDVQGCNVRLTMELMDTSTSPIATTRKLVNVLRRPESLQNPYPAAVIGASQSAVSAPLAMVTGAKNIPQISHASTAFEFDAKNEYPLFGRTIGSTTGEAEIALRFFQSINSTHVAVLYLTDTCGSTRKSSFMNAANKANVSVVSFGLSTSFASSSSSTTTTEEANNVMEALKRSGYRHVYAVGFEKYLEPLLLAAWNKGTVGPDYLYVFTSLDPFKAANLLKLPPNSPLLKAWNGVGLIDFTAMPFERIRTDTPVVSTSPSAFDSNYYKAFLTALFDQHFVDYVEEQIDDSLGLSEGMFRRNGSFSITGLSTYQPYLYDAVTAAGLAMCRAGNSSTFFTGADIYQEFRTLSFAGMSGQVKIDPDTGSRDSHTMPFILWNVQVRPDEVDTNGNVVMEFVPAGRYGRGGWRMKGDPFIYANGRAIPPSPLYDVLEEKNYIGITARASALTLMALAMFTSLVFLVWLRYYRKSIVVKSSQPLFLLMTIFGSIVMASSILPLSVEETILPNKVWLDRSCMAIPWLYTGGFNALYSALFAKMRGVRLAYSDPELDVIRVTAMDIIAISACFGFINGLLLLSWTMTSPLEWTRQYEDDMDQFGRHTKSYATCNSEYSIHFASFIMVFNVGILLLGALWSYQARNIETEYKENVYIGISMAAILQAWTIGLPILILVWEDPRARFYVQSSIIFVTTQVVVSLIFIPKVSALRSQMKTPVALSNSVPCPKHRHDRSEGENDETDAIAIFSAAALAASTDHDSMKSDVLARLAEESRDQSSRKVSFHSDSLQRSGQLDTSSVGQISSDVEHNESTSSLRRFEYGITEVGTLSRSPSKQRSRRFSVLGGAICSKSLAGPVTEGIRVTHNPRSVTNLSRSGGRELSRRQLLLLEEAYEREQKEYEHSMQINTASQMFEAGGSSTFNLESSLKRTDKDLFHDKAEKPKLRTTPTTLYAVQEDSREMDESKMSSLFKRMSQISARDESEVEADLSFDEIHEYVNSVEFKAEMAESPDVSITNTVPSPADCLYLKEGSWMDDDSNNAEKVTECIPQPPETTADRPTDCTENNKTDLTEDSIELQ